MEEEPKKSEKVKTEIIVQKPVKKFSCRNLFIGFLAIIFGVTHCTYAYTLFENDRNFSMLSDLEREMSLHSEMGFYYSYYKLLVEENRYLSGVARLLRDLLVEFPEEVNAMNRFNIMPEVIISSMYRYSLPWLNSTLFANYCHMVDRGDDVDQVESCNGPAVPMIFYLNTIWLLAGVTVAVVFMYAVSLSGSLLGGFLAVGQYFGNHSELTRVHWAPNERENMALPMLLIQSWLITIQLKYKRPWDALRLQIAILFLNCLCILFWQFTQYIFLAQIVIFFVMEQLHIIQLKELCIFLHSHFCTLHLTMFLFQGNDMLKSSLYASYFTMVCAYVIFFSSLRVRIENRSTLYIESFLIFLRFFIILLGAISMKIIVSEYLNVDDDGHVWQIFLSKFMRQNKFLVLLYTCTDVFDFLPLATLKSMTHTLLIPLSVVACFLATLSWLPKKIDKIDKDSDKDSGIENSESQTVTETKTIATSDWLVVFFKSLNVDSMVWYNLNLLVVYGLMAGLVMRLKLLLGTQLCIVCSIFMTRKYFRWHIITKFMFCMPLVAVMFAYLAYTISVNVTEELKHIGEYSDPQKEELIQWILHETSQSAVFAGSLPILATVMLCTRRPIVAHPHFENHRARQRAYTVLKTFGRFTPTELYEDLTRLRVSYLIVDKAHCYGKSNLGCSFDAMWDAEFPSRRGQPKLCHRLLTEPVDHLFPVFKNNMFTVLRLHDYSVQYMPRSFET